MPPDFRHRVRVYLEDTDLGGVVFYVNYLKFFERARTEWLRSHGINQGQLMKDENGSFVVSGTSMRFLRPARLDHELDITVVVSEFKRASLVFSQQAWHGETMLADGATRVSWVDLATFRPARFPKGLFERLNAAGPAP
jgi:acyl-CoA thioester hydrolase